MKRRDGISSIYGFIMIFLLTMASLQAWSSAVGAMAGIQNADDQSHQLQQVQGLEHLSLSLAGGNLTITNDGQVASTVEFLRLTEAGSSRILQLDAPLPVGGSLQEALPPASGVEAVTLLGNVFSLPSGPSSTGSVWAGGAGGASQNDQLYLGPNGTSAFYLGSGADVYAFSDNGSALWSFDAGAGAVVDVIPLSTGDVYAVVAYAYPSNSGMLYELDRSGGVIGAYSVRVLGSPGGTFAAPSGPIAMGGDAGYAYYDGWFYSDSGPSASLAVQNDLLAATDSADLYMYTPLGGSTYGICEPWGNEMVIASYTPGSGYPGGYNLNWTAYAYLGPCTRYDPQLMAASAANGTLAAVFAAPYYSDSSLQALPGYNPYIVVVSPTNLVVYDKEAPTNGYTSIATNGSSVYLALPALDEVQVLSIPKQTISTYDVGIPASKVICDRGHVFVVSQSTVKVYDAGMNLLGTIDLAPSTLASFSGGLSAEPSLQNPSFLVLNGSSYAALLTNSTGFTTLVLGSYG